MKKRLLMIAALLIMTTLFIGSNNTVLASTSYRASAGFTSTQGAINWYYQEWDGSGYSNMSWDAANNRWTGSHQYSIVGDGWQHASDTHDSVRKFVVPTNGVVNVSGLVRMQEGIGGDGVVVTIKHGSTTVWGPQTIAYNDISGVNHNFNVSVQQGESLYFILNRNGSTNHDTTHWNPIITYDYSEGDLLVGASDVIYDSSYFPSDFHFDQSLATLRIDNDTFNFWHAMSYAEEQTKYVGTVDDPLKTRLWKKNGLDGSYIDYNGYNGNWDFFDVWPMNLYQTGVANELVAFVHIEKRNNVNSGANDAAFTVGILYSTDNGESWDLCGEIIKPGRDFGFNVGGLPTLVVGDYFYVYFNDGTELGETERIQSVARAKITDVVNAARNHQVTTWHKYKNGNWNAEGMSGVVGSSLIPSLYGEEDIHADGAYCGPLGKYLMTVQTHSAHKLLLFSSTDGLNWIQEVIIDDTTDNVIQPYSFFLDPDGPSDTMGVVGDSFYIYYPRLSRSGGHAVYHRRAIKLKSDTEYQASMGFSDTQGERGWYYQYKTTSGSFIDMAWQASSSNWKGDSEYCLIMGGRQHPGNSDSVRKWVSAKAGTVRIKGTVKKESVGGDGVQVTVMKNGTYIWGPTDISANDLTGLSHNMLTYVAEGDVLYFIVNKKGTDAYDTTIWDPIISYN